MVKAKSKGNVPASATKPEKEDAPNNAEEVIAASETEKMDEEVPDIVTGEVDETEVVTGGEEEMEDNDDEEMEGKEEEMEEKEEETEDNKGQVTEDNNKEKETENTKEEKMQETEGEGKTEESKKEEGTGKENAQNTPVKDGKNKRLRRRKKKAKQGGADGKPADGKPADGKPVDGKPVDGKPVDGKPAEKTDKPETSAKEKEKKADSMGMIFMCSSKTKKDCYRYNIFGLPAGKKDQVAKIYKGMRLFLFDIDLKLMYGIYKASAPGGYNIEPKAFKSAFPAQVKFSVMEDCLPLSEEKFKVAIKENYFGKNKFNPQLNAEQVKNLCKIFKATTAKGRKSKQVERPIRQESRGDRDRGRGRGQGRDRGRRQSYGGERLYREPHRGYEREAAYASAARRPPPMHASLPPPLPRPVYAAYERPLEMDYYRRDGLELSRDIGYRDPYAYHESAYPVGPPAGYHQPPLYRY